MYAALSLGNVILGLLALFRPRLGFFSFVFLLLVVPSSSAFDDWDYRSGLYAYDWFFLVLLLSFPLRAAVERQSKRAYTDLLLLSGLLAVLLAVFAVKNGELDKYLFRDFRPFLFLFEAVIATAFLWQREIEVHRRDILTVGAVAAVGCAFGFLLVISGTYAAPDQFFEANSFRYLSVGAYMAPLVVLWVVSGHASAENEGRVLVVTALLLSAGVLVLAGVRMLVFATLAASFFAVQARPSQLLRATVIGLLVAGAFLAASVALEVDRVTEALTPEGILLQLAVRFGPAIAVAQQMSNTDWIVGAGLGTTFEIPWFGYRGLDTRNNFVDSSYVTFGLKYGLLSLLYAFLVLRSLYVDRLPPRVGRALVVLLALMAVTMSVPYQKYAVGLTVGVALLSRVEARRRPQSQVSFVRTET